MEYSIKLPEEFLEEIDKICNYISDELKVPTASNRLREKIMNYILLLKQSPRMFTEIKKIDRTERLYRRIAINNYVLLYTIDDKQKTIYVSHIYYSGRNYLNGELL